MERANENRMLSDAELDTVAGGLGTAASIVEPTWYAKARQMSEEFKKSHGPTLGSPIDLG
jgi:hypothetical protein